MADATHLPEGILRKLHARWVLAVLPRLEHHVEVLVLSARAGLECARV